MIVLRPMGEWGVYYGFASRDAGYRTVALSDIARIGKYNTKGHGDRYCAELNDGSVGNLVLVDNAKDVVKALRPRLNRIKSPGGLRMPPMLAWEPESGGE